MAGLDLLLAFLAFGGFVVLLALNFRDEDHAKAYRGWMPFRAPLGFQLWCNLGRRHVRPLGVAVPVILVGVSHREYWG